MLWPELLYLVFSSACLAGVGAQWDFSGSTLVTSSYVRLTPDERSKQGSIWNTVVRKDCEQSSEITTNKSAIVYLIIIMYTLYKMYKDVALSRLSYAIILE